ncbi:cytochrome P450 71A1-like [Gastrolobium bilobum]|uniref:cytochrome P450 71A1-like n=1 Tax=Gastrolobium bilobum TaxID=150636 RepID=UPI002AB220DE|nr:cytochrome P450 71A1-like [Gastrolobium bilobum]
MALLPTSVLKQLLHELNSTHYLTAFFCFVSLVFMLKLRRRNKSNFPPSPPKLPIIGHIHQLGTLPHHSFHALSHKYGPLMMLQLGQIPTLVVSSVDVAKEIFKTHDVAFSSKPQTTAGKIILYGCTDVAFAPYGDDWRQKRKICVLELLSLKRVRSFQSIREEEVAQLVDTVREACESKRSSVNLSEMLIATSNNIVSRCVLGQKYDTPDGSSSFGELGRKMMEQLAAFSVGDFFPSLGWIDVLTGQISEFKATFRALDAFFDEVIAEHKRTKRDDGQSDNKDFVEILLQIQEGGKYDFQLTHDNIKALLMDMFAGGSDTTSTLLEWTFAELMRNPKAMKKVQEEVRRVVGYKSKVDENDVNGMNYLKCVVKETLRLRPPAPLLIPRETLSDVKVKGFDIPSKTRVLVNAWAIQRDPEFWNRAEEFLPERFEEQPEVCFSGQDLQYIPFGSGRRGCPGISFGVSSAEYILANLLYWFDWKLPNIGVTTQEIDMSEIYGLTVCMKVPLRLEPTLYSFGSKPIM